MKKGFSVLFGVGALALALATGCGGELAATDDPAALEATRGGTAPAASVAVSPNPVPAYSRFTITGSGFYPNQVIHVSGNCRGAFNLVADSVGNMTWPEWVEGPMTCTYYFSQFKRNRLVLMATLQLVVV